MAKMKPQTFETFEPGTYKVQYIEFFTKDSDGLPIYVVQERKGGPVMVARYRTFAVGDGDTPSDTEEHKEIIEGPPGSIDRGQLPLLVHAFGGDASQLPKDELKALVKAEQLIKESKKEVTVVVRDGGWIQTVYDFNLPVGDYVFSYDSIPRKDDDGNPILSTTGFGTFLVVRLKVDDPSSPFNGVPEDVWINWESFQILQALAPAHYDLFIGDDIGKLSETFGGKILGTVEMAENAKRPKLNKATLRPVTDDDVSDVTGEPSLGVIEHLYQAIADAIDKKPWRESNAFSGVGSFSDAGLGWAKETLAPICAENDVPKKFDQMDDGHIRTLLEKLGRGDLANLMDNKDEPW